MRSFVLAAETANAGLLDFGGYVVASIYLLSLVLIGWLGHRAKREDSLSDFYLAGRGFGFAVLLLTLYATQYSGNTLLGFVGSAYREGFRFLVSVTFMMAIIGFYLIYAPKLQRRAQARHYITMGDYLQDRFGSQALTVFATLLGVIALANYILTNLMALGLMVTTVTGTQSSYAAGIIILAAIMLAYEILGGLRSVAWTDAIQGVILLIGVITLFVAVLVHTGGMTESMQAIRATRPEVLAAPDWSQKVKWLSTLLLVGIGIAMYPHAIQRIYAAKNAKSLQRSLQVMVFMPLFTTLLMITLGIMANAQFPGLMDLENFKEATDGVTLLWLEEITQVHPALKWLVVICVTAIIAATMSTIDSALLAVSSLMSQDIYPRFRPKASQSQLGLWGKLTSFAVITVAVVLAISMRDSTTIWALIEIKLELLCQVAPAFLIGLHWSRLRAGPVMAGMISGTVIALAGQNMSGPVSAGVYGLLVNLIVAVCGSCRGGKRS